MFRSFAELTASISGELRRTFRSFEHRNFRLYSLGQLISMSGTWMQAMALSWITYNLTNSALLLGMVSVCANVPVLLLSLLGGLLADRVDRRKVLIVTQYLAMTMATVVTWLVFTDQLQVWMILTMSVVMGTVSAFELPSRQAFVSDLVEGGDLVNAISVNSVIFNFTRMLGPALGALLLAGFDPAVCFGLNALSFLAAIVTLHRLKLPVKEKRVEKTASASAWTGVRLAFANAEIRNIIVLTFSTSFFGFQFTTLLPVFVRDVFHAETAALGLLAAASSLGALSGSLFLASRGKQEVLHRVICYSSFGVAVSLLAFALSPHLLLTAVIEVFLGASIALQLNASNSLLQLRVPEEFRGRVMSIYTMTLIGSAPLGAVVIGLIADCCGAPVAVAICAIACALAATYYLVNDRKENPNG